MLTLSFIFCFSSLNLGQNVCLDGRIWDMVGQQLGYKIKLKENLLFELVEALGVLMIIAYLTTKLVIMSSPYNEET